MADDFTNMLPRFSTSPSFDLTGGPVVGPRSEQPMPAVVPPQQPLDQRTFRVGPLVLGAGAPRPQNSLLDMMLAAGRAPNGAQPDLPALTHADLARYQGDGRIPLNAPPREMPAGIALDPAGMPRFSDPPSMDNRQIVRGSDGSARTAAATGGVPLDLDPTGQPRFSYAEPFDNRQIVRGSDGSARTAAATGGVPLELDPSGPRFSDAPSAFVDNGAQAQRFRPAGAGPAPDPRWFPNISMPSMPSGFFTPQAVDKGHPIGMNADQRWIGGGGWAHKLLEMGGLPDGQKPVQVLTPADLFDMRGPQDAAPGGSPAATGGGSPRVSAADMSTAAGRTAAASSFTPPAKVDDGGMPGYHRVQGVPFEMATKMAQQDYYRLAHQRPGLDQIRLFMANKKVNEAHYYDQMASGKDPEGKGRTFTKEERATARLALANINRTLESYMGAGIPAANATYNRPDAATVNALNAMQDQYGAQAEEYNPQVLEIR